MRPIEQAIKGYENSLCKELDILSLIQRNPVAHKWKVTYQCLCLRETVAWRFVDILGQSWLLHESGKALGARILLRSAIETIAMLIFLNQLTESVVSRKITFKDFMEKVINLFAGSRDGMTEQKATNIITVLQKCEKKYEGIERMYGWLSESAHPNYERMRLSYSNTNVESKVTTFLNKTAELYAAMQEDGLIMVMSMFEHEYSARQIGFEGLES